MKILNKILRALLAMALLAACDHRVCNETVVNEDGSIHKIFSFYQGNPKDLESEKMIGLSEGSGWTRKALHVDTAASKKAYQVQYEKTFPSVGAMNSELGRHTDSTLQITGSFETRFRWFYTYFDFSETYHHVNKMKLPIKKFVTAEDSAFVERLPAEATRISQADSLHLWLLNEKLFDRYGTEAIVDEYFNIAIGLMRSQDIQSNWEDTLAMRKELLFDALLREQNNNTSAILLGLMDSLGVPMDYAIAQRELYGKSKALESKVGFIAWAIEGSFQHMITMPGQVVHSNADSIIGKRLMFRPPVTKFLFMDHVLSATSRKLNYWAVITTLILLVFTVLLFIRKGKRLVHRKHIVQ